MKRSLFFLIIFSVCLLLLGCQQSSNNDEVNVPQKTNELPNDRNEENNMAQIDIFDFKHIKKAPEATEKQPISKVIKVFFDEWTFDDPYEAIAIDIENNEIYVNPIISARGLRAQDGIVQISNTEKIIDILNKHNVQEWKRNYTFEDPETYQDGYSWSLLLQFEDGTVEKHWGDGTNKKKLTPDNFDDFAKELNEFVKERLEDN